MSAALMPVAFTVTAYSIGVSAGMAGSAPGTQRG